MSMQNDPPPVALMKMICGKWLTQAIGAAAELEMLVMTDGGRERTEADFGALFTAAGFRMTRVVPTPAPASVVEGVRA